MADMPVMTKELEAAASTVFPDNPVGEFENVEASAEDAVSASGVAVALKEKEAVSDINVNTQTETKELVVTPKPVYDFVKRAFDLIVSFVCLTVGLPIYLLIALAIVIDSPGNPLFVQQRVGKNGRAFKMVKFRTMYKNADERKKDLAEINEYESVHFKIGNDPRVTKVGRFLRKTSLDETAQVLNLLTGTMTVVGPRPFVASEQELLPSDRLLVKPGLSCYWQITNTAKMSEQEQLELDYKYIKERSVKTDLIIIWRTIITMFKANNC